MNYTIYDYLGLFFFYAFLGWLLETSVAAIRKKHMVNRGFLNGPLCAIYGITAVFMTRYLYELQSSPVFLFLGCMIIATAAEWLAGHALERIGHGKWWDYSNKKWNFRTACHENRQSPLLYSSSFNSGRFPAYHILDSLWYIGSRCRRFLCCSAPHHEKNAADQRYERSDRRLHQTPFCPCLPLSGASCGTCLSGRTASSGEKRENRNRRICRIIQIDHYACSPRTPVKSLTISPATISPATAGTNALLPGTCLL